MTRIAQAKAFRLGESVSVVKALLYQRVSLSIAKSNAQAVLTRQDCGSVDIWSRSETTSGSDSNTACGSILSDSDLEAMWPSRSSETARGSSLSESDSEANTQTSPKALSLTWTG